MDINVTVTAANSVELADQINAAFAAGDITEVNGRKLISRYGGDVARSWQNGTVSVKVEGRRSRLQVGDVYVKVGGTLRAH
jgi:hypothetical protein